MLTPRTINCSKRFRIPGPPKIGQEKAILREGTNSTALRIRITIVSVQQTVDTTVNTITINQSPLSPVFRPTRTRSNTKGKREPREGTYPLRNKSRAVLGLVACWLGGESQHPKIIIIIEAETTVAFNRDRTISVRPLLTYISSISSIKSHKQPS
jgi:hypothetical protein